MSKDYSSRDIDVKSNVYASVRRRDGLPQNFFANYWRDVHSTVCSRLPGLTFYVQQHFDRSMRANLWPIPSGITRIDAILDGSAELGFSTQAGQVAFQKASQILYADERNIFSESIGYSLPEGSITFVDREENGNRNGPDQYHRLHVYMNRRSNTDATRWIKDISSELSSQTAVTKWKLHLPVPYDNDNPAPPAPDVSHVLDAARKNVAVAEVAFENARTAREFFESSLFQKSFSQQERFVDAIGAYLLTGYYTFVRDGKPTTAGLRGSRAAALIDKLGAANQLLPEIAKHFYPAYFS